MKCWKVLTLEKLKKMMKILRERIILGILSRPPDLKRQGSKLELVVQKKVAAKIEEIHWQ